MVGPGDAGAGGLGGGGGGGLVADPVVGPVRGGAVLRGDLLGVVHGVGGAARAALVHALGGEVPGEVVAVLPGGVEGRALVLRRVGEAARAVVLVARLRPRDRVRRAADLAAVLAVLAGVGVGQVDQGALRAGGLDLLRTAGLVRRDRLHGVAGVRSRGPHVVLVVRVRGGLALGVLQLLELVDLVPGVVGQAGGVLIGVDIARRGVRQDGLRAVLEGADRLAGERVEVVLDDAGAVGALGEVAVAVVLVGDGLIVGGVDLLHPVAVVVGVGDGDAAGVLRRGDPAQVVVGVGGRAQRGRGLDRLQVALGVVGEGGGDRLRRRHLRGDLADLALEAAAGGGRGVVVEGLVSPARALDGDGLGVARRVVGVVGLLVVRRCQRSRQVRARDRLISRHRRAGPGRERGAGRVVAGVPAVRGDVAARATGAHGVGGLLHVPVRVVLLGPGLFEGVGDLLHLPVRVVLVLRRVGLGVGDRGGAGGVVRGGGVGVGPGRAGVAGAVELGGPEHRGDPVLGVVGEDGDPPLGGGDLREAAGGVVAEDGRLALGVGRLRQVSRSVEVEDGGAAGVVLGLPLVRVRLDEVHPAARAALGQLESLVLVALVVLRDGDGALVAVGDLRQRAVLVVGVLGAGLAVGQRVRAVHVLRQVLGVALRCGEGAVRLLRERRRVPGGVEEHHFVRVEVEVALVLLPPPL